MCVVGTTAHVNHGKSIIIKALATINLDCLVGEKMH